MICIKNSKLLFLIFIGFFGCKSHGRIESIFQSNPSRNALRFQVDLITTDSLTVQIEYWQKGDSLNKSFTNASESALKHHFVLTNLLPKHSYEYRILTQQEDYQELSRIYDFSTPDFPIWIQDVFRVLSPDSTVVPSIFQEGYTLLSRRESPGIIFMVDVKGKIRWYHQVNGTGFKTTHFTPNKTILSILGTEAFPTSYGDEILELSLEGDTLFRLKKGEKDFDKTIHHEIILNDKNEIVTLSVEEKILNLSAIGGSKQDTIKSDGIMILDRNGKKVWSWSLFDALDPLSQKNILKEKADWMHANSLKYDTDGNFLISFYNNGQVWKLDSKTGNVIWKFGKGGDFKIPKAGYFDHAHAAHRNAKGDLTVFDNGTDHSISRTLSFRLDEKNKTAEIVDQVKLPSQIYSARMGSSFLITSDSYLQCSSKTNSVVLSNTEGRLLWLLKSNFMPYRAEFVSGKQVNPYLSNP